MVPLLKDLYNIEYIELLEVPFDKAEMHLMTRERRIGIVEDARLEVDPTHPIGINRVRRGGEKNIDRIGEIDRQKIDI